MKNVTISIILLFFIQTPLFAQHLIKGQVVDAISRQPLEFALISTKTLPLTNTLTDHNANFVLKSGSQLLVSFVGYKPKTVSAENNEGVIISLEPSAVMLKDFAFKNNIHSKITSH